MKYLLFVLLICFLTSCEQLEYKDDLGFMSSAAANSPEVPAMVGGKLCIDMDKLPGLCSKRVKSNQPIVITIPKQQYQYKVSLDCSQDTGISIVQDVPEGLEWSYTIKPEDFITYRQFSCIGELFPADRKDNPNASAKFSILFQVVDADYIQREDMFIAHYKGKDYLILGEHAKYGKIWDVKNGKKIIWNTKNQSYIRIFSPDKVKAISESFNMRYNIVGFE